MTAPIPTPSDLPDDEGTPIHDAPSGTPGGAVASTKSTARRRQNAQSWLEEKGWVLTPFLFGFAGALALLLTTKSPVYKFETSFFDFLMRQRAAEVLDGPDDPLTVVGYDEPSEQLYGLTPGRGPMNRALEHILAAEPTAVVIDFNFGRDNAEEAVRLAIRDIRALMSRRSPEVDRILGDVQARYDVTSPLLQTLSHRRVIGTFYSSGHAATAADSVAAPPELKHIDDRGSCANFPRAQSLNLDAEEFRKAYANYGNARQEPDVDSLIRRYPLFVGVGPKIYPSLAIAAAALYRDEFDMGLEGVSVDCDPAQQKFVTGFNVGASEPVDLSDSPDGKVWIRYGGPFEESFPNWISFKDVLEPGKIAPERFKGKMVFFGPKSDYNDKYPTYNDVRFPGVGIHATVAHSVATGNWINRPRLLDDFWEPAACLILAAVIALLFWAFESSWILALTAVFPIAGYLVSAQMLGRGVLVDAFLPGIVAGMAVFMTAGTRFISERRRANREQRRAESEKKRAEAEQQKRLATEAEFRRFLSPNVAALAVENPRVLEPARAEISILFSDIRGFTTTAEGLTPEQLVALLADYLTKMTDIVFANDGTLDKYIGDAVMALFGAPVKYDGHAAKSCRAALQMCDALDLLNAEWKRQNRPLLNIGIGINTGVVSVGRMGSTAKVEYTCIGDEVNFASRVEGLSKAYGTRIIVGENTRVQAGDEFVFRDLGPVKVKGKTRGVRVFEVLGTRETMKDTGFVTTFDQAIEAFNARKWDDAERLFDKVIELRGKDGPSAAFKLWTKTFRAHPPGEGWDGTLERDEK